MNLLNMKTNLLNATATFKSVGGILLAIVILLIMVMIHEFGHYIAGKLLGFKINEFSVGFGPAILKKRSKKTGELFALRIIPLGGFCAFDGEDEMDEEEKLKEDSSKDVSESKSDENSAFPEFNENEVEKNASITSKSEENIESTPLANTEVMEDIAVQNKGKKFNDQPPWKRIIVLIAGATMNYLLALVLIIIMFSVGGQPLYKVIDNPDPSGSTTQISMMSETDLLSEETSENSLQVGDIIEKINGKRMFLITDYIDELNGKKAGDQIQVQVIREIDGKDQTLTVTMTLAEDGNFKNMNDAQTLLKSMGIYGLSSVSIKRGAATIGYAFGYSGKLGGMILRSLGQLLTGKISITSMGGPITTIKVTGQAASNGFIPFLNIAAFIGVNLAVFNLLPIPALDGSKVVFCIIEWIRKKPLNRKVETMIHFIGIIVLFGFAILVDVLQFIL